MADVLASLAVLAVMVGISVACLLAARWLARSDSHDDAVSRVARRRAGGRRDDARARGLD